MAQAEVSALFSHIASAMADQVIPVFGSKGASIHVREMVQAFAVMGHEASAPAARRGNEVGPQVAEVIEASVSVASGALACALTDRRNHSSLREGLGRTARVTAQGRTWPDHARQGIAILCCGSRVAERNQEL